MVPYQLPCYGQATYTPFPKLAPFPTSHFFAMEDDFPPPETFCMQHMSIVLIDAKYRCSNNSLLSEFSCMYNQLFVYVYPEVREVNGD
jgi:hypothetical protein